MDSCMFRNALAIITVFHSLFGVNFSSRSATPSTYEIDECWTFAANAERRVIKNFCALNLIILRTASLSPTSLRGCSGNKLKKKYNNNAGRVCPSFRVCHLIEFSFFFGNSSNFIIIYIENMESINSFYFLPPDTEVMVSQNFNVTSNILLSIPEHISPKLGMLSACMDVHVQCSNSKTKLWKVFESFDGITWCASVTVIIDTWLKYSNV